ncbi:MAG: tripartite tricarboxylate transporter substrate binding protein [Betaproteobacteria bacterium]|nr:tripartite tricarboxylate transporter substrate binding protein [Betaproteobacteria bacterium]
MKSALFIFTAILSFFAMMPAGAQEAYPSRPIRLLMPFGAGGTVDIMTRPLAAKLHEQLKRPVIVDNRPSAGGVLAAELAANATPDGYTLFLASSSALFVAPAYYKKVNYDPIKDFAPISLIAQQPLLIVANTSLPFRDVKGLIAYAKERPGKLNYGTVGLGSTNHFTAELLSHAAGIKMVLVPYKSGAQGVAAAIGGEVELVFTQPNTGLPHVKAGRVNAIATTGVKRHPLYPDVGTLVEAGYEDLAITGYYTVVGPAKLPRPIVQRLNSEIRRAMESPGVGDVLRNQGTEPVTSTPEELATLMKQETARWQRAAKLTGIKEK